MLAIFDQGLVKENGQGNAHVLSIAEEEYPAECGFVLRQLHEAMAEEEVRRSMQGEDMLLRDSILLAQQVDYQERQAAHERQRAQRAEQGQQRAEQGQQRAELKLAQAIRRLHDLGQDADAIAAALSVEVEEVRRVLSA